MSSQPDAPNGAAANDSGNSTANDPNYFESLSSMSTLASAAHAQGGGPPPEPQELNEDQQQGQQQEKQEQPDNQPQNTPGKDQPSSAAFTDLDSALYNVLSDPNADSHSYGEFEAAASMDASQVGGADGGFSGAQSSNAFTAWYDQQSLPDILSNYQGLPDPQSTIRVEHVRNGTTAANQSAQAAGGLNGDTVVVKSHAPKASRSPEISKALKRISKVAQRQAVESSGVSPPPASQPPQSRASTPLENDEPSKADTHSSTISAPDRSSLRSRSDFRPKTSIPTDLAPEEYARQCIQAALASRLSPFALHPEEYELLRDHINHLQVTSYLNIRNGILRLWTRNPLVGVTREEASGCAKDYRWFDAADVAYEWLVRRGYINFGCLEVPDTIGTLGKARSKRKTIVVIGAGMAGLGCARQLEGLFSQFGERWTERGEEVPKVIVVEGRGRIGGRVYSHPLRTQVQDNLPQGLRCTADLGAQIITGFDNGNPLSVIIRGQLALHYHQVKDNSVLYDSDGMMINKDRDGLVENLFNDILERASVYRHKAEPPQTAEGDRELIESGRDPTGEGSKVISQSRDSETPAPPVDSSAGPTKNGTIDMVPAGLDKLTGKAHLVPGSSAKVPAAEQVITLGWPLKAGVLPKQNLDLDSTVDASEHPSLGAVMDEALHQYQDLVHLTPQDMRLLNWHYANLEYANAANLHDLSLSGWDQDIGNEFEGEHAEIVGGYLQVPRGLWRCPSKLDVRKSCVVKRIVYSPEVSSLNDGKVTVECANGMNIEADAVVCTLPLGVLKERSVAFEPPLPDWKKGPIKRLGFGTLNKVVLVYEKPFWDVERDMFGVLRKPEVPASMNQNNYVAGRGRFYLFWNCIKTSGRPMLVALMAGDAAHQTEINSDDDLVAEATTVLGKIFSHNAEVPEPSEVIITRWGRDKFARGSYSYVGVTALPEDYDLMAKPVGNLYFAGEATCGTHPATVHGAYLSGLRAASNIVDALVGPINIPSPLVPPKPRITDPVPPSSTSSHKRKASSPFPSSSKAAHPPHPSSESALNIALHEALGSPPPKPGRLAANPFLLYQKDHWAECKANCDAATQKRTGNAEAKASRNEVRASLGQMWRDAPEAVRAPYLEAVKDNKEGNARGAAEWKKEVAEWEAKADEFRKNWRAQNGLEGRTGGKAAAEAGDGGSGKRVRREKEKEREKEKDVEMGDGEEGGDDSEGSLAG